MCGIACVFDAQPERLLRRLSILGTRLAHRGPDASGALSLRTSEGLGLGFVHRRLAVIDVTHAADQPMEDEFGNVLVFNGEIYNYRELRTDLEARGEQFRTSSDTEVLLRAYRYFEHRVLLRRLRGMFAFALWDAAEQKVIIARDPMGIKPLYFVKKGGFSCASESSALVDVGLADHAISREGLDSFLAFGSVVAPYTIWRDVEALMPGHYMCVDAGGRARQQTKYWTWEECRGSDKLDEALVNAMDRHLVSDVPLSLFLSGGYDSTAIATLAAQRSEIPLHTFTVTIANRPDLGEGREAEVIAGRLKSVHHEVLLDAGGVRDQLFEFFVAMDQPSDDGLNVKLISSVVADAGFKVALHGVGGDELFGGYPSFRDLPRTLMLRCIPRWVRRLAAAGIQGDAVARSKLAEVLRGDISLLSSFLVRRRLFSHEQRRALMAGETPLGPAGVPESWLANIRAEVNGADDVFAAISRLELSLYAANKLLVDGDVMSMSRGLEVRFPLLDVDVVKAAQCLPGRAKRPNGEITKPALVHAVRGFPHDLMSRRKRGFTLPMERWMRSELRDECRSLLEGVWDGLGLDGATVNTIWQQYEKSAGGQQWLRAWQLVALGGWYRHRVNGNHRIDAA